MMRLLVNPFPQAALKRPVTEFEGSRRKRRPRPNGHHARFISGNGGDDGNEFGMGKPDGHGGSCDLWRQGQPSLAQEDRFANMAAEMACR